MSNLQVHTVKNVCEKCGRSFKYTGNFVGHKCLLCSSCGRVFYRQKDLSNHVCSSTLECLVCHRSMPKELGV